MITAKPRKSRKTQKFLQRISALILSVCFLIQNIYPAYAQGIGALPPPIQSPLALNFPLLKYISVNSVNPHNYFNFLLDKGLPVTSHKSQVEPPFEKGGTGGILNQEAKKLINYFFLGITIPNKSLWVNLQPNQEDKITSTELSNTDLGRTLLEQDLQLKKDVAKLLHPQNPVGKIFWTKLYESIENPRDSSVDSRVRQAKTTEPSPNLKNLKIQTNNRVWIVPDEAVVVETEDGALVSKATLKVLLENEYLNSAASNGGTAAGGDEAILRLNKNDDNIQILSEQLMKQIIIPEITKNINTSETYAPLRQIYHSLILAEWFKRKQYMGNSVEHIGDSKNVKLTPKRYPLNAKTRPYSVYINSSITRGLESNTPWSKDALFQDYIKSYTQGEYKIRDTIFGLKRMYFSGGAEFDSLSINPQTGLSALRVIENAIKVSSPLPSELQGLPKDTVVAKANTGIADGNTLPKAEIQVVNAEKQSALPLSKGLKTAVATAILAGALLIPSGVRGQEIVNKPVAQTGIIFQQEEKRFTEEEKNRLKPVQIYINYIYWDSETQQKIENYLKNNIDTLLLSKMMLFYNDVRLKHIIIQLLEERRSPETVNILIAACKYEKDIDVQLHILKVLSTINSPEVIYFLKEAIEEKRYSYAKAVLVAELMEIDSPQARNAFVELLNNVKDVEYRDWIVESLLEQKSANSLKIVLGSEVLLDSKQRPYDLPPFLFDFVIALRDAHVRLNNPMTETEFKDILLSQPLSDKLIVKLLINEEMFGDMFRLLLGEFKTHLKASGKSFYDFISQTANEEEKLQLLKQLAIFSDFSQLAEELPDLINDLPRIIFKDNQTIISDSSRIEAILQKLLASQIKGFEDKLVTFYSQLDNSDSRKGLLKTIFSLNKDLFSAQAQEKLTQLNALDNNINTAQFQFIPFDKLIKNNTLDATVYFYQEEWFTWNIEMFQKQLNYTVQVREEGRVTLITNTKGIKVKITFILAGKTKNAETQSPFVIHRGHSYQTPETINKLSAETALFMPIGCRGLEYVNRTVTQKGLLIPFSGTLGTGYGEVNNIIVPAYLKTLADLSSKKSATWQDFKPRFIENYALIAKKTDLKRGVDLKNYIFLPNDRSIILPMLLKNLKSSSSLSKNVTNVAKMAIATGLTAAVLLSVPADTIKTRDKSVITKEVTRDSNIYELEEKARAGNGATFEELIKLGLQKDYDAIYALGLNPLGISDNNKAAYGIIKRLKEDAFKGNNTAITILQGLIISEDARNVLIELARKGNYDATIAIFNYDTGKPRSSAEKEIFSAINIEALMLLALEGDPKAIRILDRLILGGHPSEKDIIKFLTDNSRVLFENLVQKFSNGNNEARLAIGEVFSYHTEKFNLVYPLTGRSYDMFNKLAESFVKKAIAGDEDALWILHRILSEGLIEDSEKEILRSFNPEKLIERVRQRGSPYAFRVLEMISYADSQLAYNGLITLAAKNRNVLAIDYFKNFTSDSIVMPLRYDHLVYRVSRSELEYKLTWQSRNNDSFLLYLSYISPENFGDLAKIIWQRLESQAQAKGKDLQSFLQDLDPQRVFYMDFILQAANFNHLEKLYSTEESLYKVMDLLFKDLSKENIENNSTRLALFVEKILSEPAFVYQKRFQQYLRALYDLTKGVNQRLVAALLIVYQDKLVYLDKNDIVQIGLSQNIQSPDTRIHYDKLFKDGRILAHMVFADKDAVDDHYEAAAELFQGKNPNYPDIGGYTRLPSLDKTQIVLEKEGVRLVLIKAGWGGDYDINENPDAGIVISRSHSGNEHNVFAKRGYALDSTGKVFFMSACRSVTKIGGVSRDYPGASIIGVNEIAEGIKSNIVSYYLLEGLRQRIPTFPEIKTFIQPHSEQTIKEYVFPGDRSAIVKEIVSRQDASSSLQVVSPAIKKEIVESVVKNTLNDIAKEVLQQERAPRGGALSGIDASSPIGSSPLAKGGIDLSQIEVTLQNEQFVSSLNPADFKILLAAKALKQGASPLSLLRVHEVMGYLRDKIVKSDAIQNQKLFKQVLSELRLNHYLDFKALSYLKLFESGRGFVRK